MPPHTPGPAPASQRPGDGFLPGRVEGWPSPWASTNSKWPPLTIHITNTRAASGILHVQMMITTLVVGILHVHMMITVAEVGSDDVQMPVAMASTCDLYTQDAESVGRRGHFVHSAIECRHQTLYFECT